MIAAFLPLVTVARKLSSSESTTALLSDRQFSGGYFSYAQGAMARFRDIKTLQKFTAVHSSLYNHFNHQRNLNRRQIFKQYRAAALVEWRELAA